MYVLDRYSVKQPQNYYKNKNIELEKKNPGKKLNVIYIIAFTYCLSQLVAQFYLHQEKLLS